MMKLDLAQIARKKRSKKVTPTSELSFDTKTVYKIMIDRVAYFAQCSFPAERTVDAAIMERIQSSKTPLEMSAVTKLTFGLGDALRRPVTIKFIGDAPKKMSGKIMISPYHLLNTASSSEIARLVREFDIEHPLQAQ